MCRFVLYLGNEITLDVLTTRPTNSIIHQSYDSHLGREPLNGDGFGLAWYVPRVSSEPAQFRSIQPAWNNVNLRHLARVCSSPSILAHVRAATPGSGVSESNCHPFTAGRFAFMHNGSVAEFGRLKRRIVDRLSDESFSALQGTTDSEHLFAIFRDRYVRCEDGGGAVGMANALRATIAEIVELMSDVGVRGDSFLNVAVTDGSEAVVSRYATGSAQSPSLYVASGTDCTCESGVSRLTHCGGPPSAIIVASEPLNDDPGWEPVPHNHLLLIRADRSIDLIELG